MSDDIPGAPDTADDDRFRELVARYHGPLMAYALRLTAGDRNHAEDAVQETFIRAWRHLDRLTPQYGSVNGWLRRVTHNLVMDGFRTLQARPTEVDLADALGTLTDDGTVQVIDSLVVRQALASLWPEHRTALVEVYLHGRTNAEAAELLGIPVGTVKSRVHYALRALRASVTDRTLLAG